MRAKSWADKVGVDMVDADPAMVGAGVGEIPAFASGIGLSHPPFDAIPSLPSTLGSARMEKPW